MKHARGNSEPIRFSGLTSLRGLVTGSTPVDGPGVFLRATTALTILWANHCLFVPVLSRYVVDALTAGDADVPLDPAIWPDTAEQGINPREVLRSRFTCDVTDCRSDKESRKDESPADGTRFG